MSDLLLVLAGATEILFCFRIGDKKSAGMFEIEEPRNRRRSKSPLCLFSLISCQVTIMTLRGLWLMIRDIIAPFG